MHWIIARARPAEVSEPLITPFLYKAAATEVRCGIELSPCSVACPSGTIYTSLRPHLCIELRDGTSVGWPLDRVRICISDDATAGMDASISLLLGVCIHTADGNKCTPFSASERASTAKPSTPFERAPPRISHGAYFYHGCIGSHIVSTMLQSQHERKKSSTHRGLHFL